MTVAVGDKLLEGIEAFSFEFLEPLLDFLMHFGKLLRHQHRSQVVFRRDKDFGIEIRQILEHAE